MEGGRDVSCVVECGEKEGWWLLCRAEKKQNMGRGWVGGCKVTVVGTRDERGIVAIFEMQAEYGRGM